MEVVRVKDITKKYVQGKEEIWAVKNATFSINKGEFVSFLGPSGSGKTTLLQILGLLLEPTSGKLFINGVDASTMTKSQRAKLRRKEIGFVFQQFNLIPHLTVEENVALPMMLDERDEDEIRERVSLLLERLNLSNRAKNKAKNLSGGQMQRVAIARALANNPSLILADEPTGNLDSKNGLEVMKLLKELNEEGQTIVLITHDKHIAEWASRFFFIKDGNVKEIKDVNEVM
jgi:putative ABC transport system ATP-binding protein